MSLVVLDTDVASAILRQRLPERARARLAGTTVFITFVTLGEVTKVDGAAGLGTAATGRPGGLAATRGRAASRMRTWRRPGGQLQARARRRGRPRPVNDTWIAACCLVHRLPLATFNTKDFADFARYDGLDLLDIS